MAINFNLATIVVFGGLKGLVTTVVFLIQIQNSLDFGTESFIIESLKITSKF